MPCGPISHFIKYGVYLRHADVLHKLPADGGGGVQGGCPATLWVIVPKNTSQVGASPKQYKFKIAPLDWVRV